MSILESVKTLLRISSATTAFDEEIYDLILAAQYDLKLSGILAIKAEDDTDALIKRAVSVYVKANFGLDNPDADKFQKSYDSLKAHLTLSQEYTMFAVTFTVKIGTTLLPDAIVTFNEQKKITNSLGIATFIGISEAQNMEYTVTLDGYENVENEIDVDASMSVAVSMTAVI